MTTQKHTEQIADVIGEMLSAKQQRLMTPDAAATAEESVCLDRATPGSNNMPTSKLVTKTTQRLALLLATTSLLTVGACGEGDKGTHDSARASTVDGTAFRAAGTVLRIVDTSYAGATLASGVAEPMQHAMLSTKLMGTVTSVAVHEGDAVRAGQTLLQIDARELSAKRAQIAAAIADAEAMQSEASVQASRLRALYADSAATRAQYDAAATGLARATAGVASARAAAGELDAMSSYATVRAPFAGTVTQRMVDVGAFAAPGAPLLVIDDGSSLRIKVTVAADVARVLKRSQRLNTTIDGEPAEGTVEGVVAGGAGNLFAVNVIVSNSAARFRAGSAATIAVPGATIRGVLIPAAALVRDGDLTGVMVRGATRDERRWIRVGQAVGDLVEVSSGLRVGEEIVVPNSATSAAKPGA